jgi:hypothetical protein
VGSALLASADGYTPRANAALDRAREELGTIAEIANALADNLPAPKLTARKSRRRRRKRKGPAPAQEQGREQGQEIQENVTDGQPEAPGIDGASPEPSVDDMPAVLAEHPAEDAA